MPDGLVYERSELDGAGTFTVAPPMPAARGRDCCAAAVPVREICAIVGAAPEPRSRDCTLCSCATFVVGVGETCSIRASCSMRLMRSGGAGWSASQLVLRDLSTVSRVLKKFTMSTGE